MAMSEVKTKPRIAREIWGSAQPITGTLVDIYFGSRGISPPYPAPKCLRYAAKLTHPNGQFFPAMIALPTNPKTGEPTGGVQRTFLAWSGKGKAQVEKNEQKMSLGHIRGGVVRLAEPVEGRPLLLGEGVETVMTVIEATGLPGWATLGTSGLVNLDLPDTVTEVILLAENDGGPNEKALNEVLPALKARGVKVLVARPPPGLKDFNDLVNGKSGHSPEAGRIAVKEAIEATTKSEAEIEREREAENDEEDEEGKFSLTESGLWWRNRKGKNSKWKWIAQPFEILGWARDAADTRGQSGDWGKAIRFCNCDGVEHEAVVTLASLHSDPGALISSLAHWGMNQMHPGRAPAVCRIPRFCRCRRARCCRTSQRLARDRRRPRFRPAQRDHHERRQGAGDPGEGGRRPIQPKRNARGLGRKRRHDRQRSLSPALLDRDGACGDTALYRWL
jgi:hypothetical protein